MKNKFIKKATPALDSPSIGVDGAGRVEFVLIQPTRLSLLIFVLGCAFLYLITGCGDNSTSNAVQEATGVPSWQLLPLADTQKTQDAIVLAAAPNDCPHSKVYLASDISDWRIVNGVSFATQDILTIKQDCTLRTFACGTLGYVMSGGVSMSSGTVRVMLLGHVFPNAGCLPLGETICAYSMDGVGELRISCQLVTPLSAKFEP